MHYGAYAFAKNRYKPTIIARNGNGELGQRKGFSKVALISLIPPYFIAIFVFENWEWSTIRVGASDWKETQKKSKLTLL